MFKINHGITLIIHTKTNDMTMNHQNRKRMKKSLPKLSLREKIKPTDKKDYS